MNRKNFIRTSLLGASVSALIPKTIYAVSEKAASSLTNPKIVRQAEGKVLNVIGDYQTLKLTGADTNGQFTLIEEENVPGTAIPMHVHAREDEVFKVLEGKMELTVGGKTTVLNAGDIGYGPRGIPHSWKIIGETKAKVILSVFPAGIEIMFEELSSLPAGPPDFAKVSAICANYGITFV